MTTATETAQNPADDDFEALFAQFANKDETEDTVTAPAVAQEAAATAEPAVEAPAEAPEETAEAPEETAEAPEEVEEQPKAAAEPAKPAANSDEDLLNRLAALVKGADEKPAQKEEPAAPKAEEAPIYTPEEQETLESYLNDWPDVAKAEALRRRGEYQQLIGYMFQEVAKELKPLMEAVQVLSERTHLSDLQNAVTDYGDVRDKVIEWVGTQPAYLQTAYKHVITSGTVEEVADLIDRYKREAGVTQQAAPVSKKATELPPATKKAAAALAPVSSKRSAVVQASDPNDFEAAFQTFAEKL